MCFKFDSRLAKRVCATCPDIQDMISFGVKLAHLNEKHTEKLQILEVDISIEFCLGSVCKILKNITPNLRQFRIVCNFTSASPSCHEFDAMQLLRFPFSRKPNLTSFSLAAKEGTKFLAYFIQVILNASENLKEITIPWGFCPHFANSKSLEALTFALDAVKPREVVLFKYLFTFIHSIEIYSFVISHIREGWGNVFFKIFKRISIYQCYIHDQWMSNFCNYSFFALCLINGVIWEIHLIISISNKLR